ncbi:PGN_0703 family putative restriction endonuclease [Minwuia thermotolerans]|uniref:PGN_0703 family putative restriction endonuclease n=1 Tax=Minwuia thermotolerans TaxID=2056226 RepID=UPI000D6DC3BA|nr:hypothetical protein [Minwuia thermotolerans]
MLNPSVRAAQALAAAYTHTHPSRPLDGKGYAETAEANLLEGVRLEDFRQDFEQGDGNELEGKFLAAHSSSAFAANCFGPFKTRPEELELVGKGGFTKLGFERKCPTGLRGKSPNLDLVAQTDDQIIAVESKCTEYLTSHEARFADAYSEKILDDRRDGPWFAEMERLKQDPRGYVHLDAAQLIKHAFGLAYTFPGQKVMLLYLYWEPANPEADPAFARHQAEIEAFAERTSEGFPRFASLSYPALWKSWNNREGPDWLRAHVANLQARYLVEI